jgi:rRNA-processing protein FCF1
MTQSILLDTNVFNRILDGLCEPCLFEKYQIFVTHIQRDELAATGNDKRRSELMRIFHSIPTTQASTETSIWNDTPWNEGMWSSDNGVYDVLFKRIQELDRKSKNKSLNQSRDARIADVAIANGFTLITTDAALATAAKESGCHVLSVIEIQRNNESN